MKNWSENIDFIKVVDMVMGNYPDGKFICAESVGELNKEPVWEIKFEQYYGGFGEDVVCTVRFNAYGFVNRRKDDSFYQIFPEKDLNSLKQIVKYVASVNKGKEIDGKTYLEAFKELYKAEKTKSYDKEISKAQEKMTTLINRKIQLLQQVNEFTEEIALEKEDGQEINLI